MFVTGDRTGLDWLGLRKKTGVVPRLAPPGTILNEHTQSPMRSTPPYIAAPKFIGLHNAEMSFLLVLGSSLIVSLSFTGFFRFSLLGREDFRFSFSRFSHSLSCVDYCSISPSTHSTFFFVCVIRFTKD